MVRDLAEVSPAVRAARTDAGARVRLPELDAMRGLIMIVMALDHARAFIAKNHPGEFWGRALPDYGGDTLAFLTRLVTHLCAPGFMFLMGAGMMLLAASRTDLGWTRGRIVRHFVVRGALLIVLGQLLENGAALFGLMSATHVEDYGLRPPGANGAFPFLVLPVLYGLGSALILAAPLVRWSGRALCAAAAACVLLTLWITPGPARADEAIHPLLRLLFLPGQTGRLLVIYSTVPWLTAVFLGMAFGRALLVDRARAYARLAVAGGVCLALFVALRLAGGFGVLDRPGAGWMGFLSVVKYPPSLSFFLLTLGVDFAILGALARLDAGRRRWAQPLLVFGSVPFFFFIAHAWLYAAMGRAWPAGLSIAQMYPLWLLGVVLLYVPCRWYGAFKRRLPSDAFLRLL